MAREIHAGGLSARETVEAHLAQIEALDPSVNAIVTRFPELAVQRAREADEAQARGEPLGPLHGLPIAHKHAMLTRGLRTTFGSPIFQDYVPDQDALIVERLRAAGTILLGKTNMPEFGAGSQTFNPVHGETRNPYDLTKTCGGSSGGAAVALACRMLPIADGSDMGGSLRNPASFCNVVGLRTSPGRVPSWPSNTAWAALSVEGPMARSAADAALLLSAIAGPDARSPISIDEPGARFARPLERDFRGVRVAWSRKLGGLPVDARVTAALESQRAQLEAIGCTVEDAEPDFSDADLAFERLRAHSFEAGLGMLMDRARERMKDTLVWNIEAGRALDGPAIAEAERAQTRVYHAVRKFLQDYEFLLAPVSQVPPFDLCNEWVREIDGTRMDTYIEWMRSCSRISVVGNPALSVPCAFTPDGLPVGLQIVGRHRDDFGVLQLAHAFESATRTGERLPPALAE